jgi:hypothetical protein
VPRNLARAEADVRSVARAFIHASFASDDVKAGLPEALSRWQRGPSGASAGPDRFARPSACRLNP